MTTFNVFLPLHTPRGPPGLDEQVRGIGTGKCVSVLYTDDLIGPDAASAASNQPERPNDAAAAQGTPDCASNLGTATLARLRTLVIVPDAVNSVPKLAFDLIMPNASNRYGDKKHTPLYARPQP